MVILRIKSKSIFSYINR